MLLLLVAIVGASCVNSELKKQFGKADDLTIYFYTREGTDSVYKIVHTTDEKAITKLLDFIDKKNGIDKSCSYNGKIKLSKGTSELGILSFNTNNPACRVFSFAINGRQNTVTMSNEAADFLIALREGRGFY